ncbi:hypothetical protein DENSPDRAFT_887299 [Dentipellis sp. KUC8613]|nr:hypothetical protein DENSPDRAFT_887299 [Dentipellis sp. KUC8613]
MPAPPPPSPTPPLPSPVLPSPSPASVTAPAWLLRPARLNNGAQRAFHTCTRSFRTLPVPLLCRYVPSLRCQTFGALIVLHCLLDPPRCHLLPSGLM